MFGALITFFGVAFLYWGTRVRDHDFEAQVALLNLEAAQARLEQERLKAAVSWRRITREQHDALVSKLNGLQIDLWIGTVGNDPEAVQFWEDIVLTMRHANLKKVTPHASMQRAVGLFILPSKPENNDNKERRAVIDAFDAAGLPLIDAVGELPKSWIEIVVGSRPPPF